MPAERIAILTSDSLTTRPVNTIIVQGSSSSLAAVSSVSAATITTSSQLKSTTPKVVGGKAIAQNVNSIIMSAGSDLGGVEAAGSVKAITVDTSPHGGATITSPLQAIKPVTVVANDGKLTLKRSLPGGSCNPGVVTKVIITRNPSSNQPVAMPVQLAGFSSNAAGGEGNRLSHTLVRNLVSTSPTKTVTINSQGIVSSPGKTVFATLPGSPTKVSIPVSNSKMAISPAKTPTKITMIPVSIPKSPSAGGQARLALSGAGQTITVLPRTLSGDSTGTNSASTLLGKPATITMSPSKVIIKQAPNKAGPLKTPTHIAPAGQGGTVTLQLPLPGSGTSVQQVQVPGSKFHYVRLVTPAQSSIAVTKPVTTVSKVIPAVRPIAPATCTATNQVKITLPVTHNVQLTNMGGKAGSIVASQKVQRIILPAGSTTSLPIQAVAASGSTTTIGTTGTGNLAPIRPNIQLTSSVPRLSNLPPGTTLLTPSTTLPGLQSFALVPAHYVTQLQLNKPAATLTAAPTTQQSLLQPQVQPPQTQQQQHPKDYVSIASSDPAITNLTIQRNTVNGSTFEATGARPRKPCNCTKSHCLKLYCDCFANGEFCHNCNCNNCANNLEHEEERSRAIKSCLDRNPMAFHPKIGKGKDCDGNRRHNKGCNCKRSGCLKNYCECYEAKIMCSSYCKCIGCKNFEESYERKTLMHLADAAEVRVQQQTAAKTKLSSQISGIPSKPPSSSANGERLPFTLITADVAEATSACLLAQAEEAERLKMPPVVQERMVIEEFGRCLMQIIESANKTKAAAVAAVAAADV